MILKISVFFLLLYFSVILWYTPLKAIKEGSSLSSKLIRMTIINELALIIMIECLALPICFLLTTSFSVGYYDNQKKIKNMLNEGYWCIFCENTNISILILEVIFLGFFVLFCVLIKSVNFTRRVYCHSFGLK